MRVYEQVIGIGQDCANANYLRLHGLRRFSSPFDWVAGWNSGFERYVELICADFVGFVEQEDFRLMEHPTGPDDDMAHDYYRNVRTGMGFFHDIPIHADLSEVFPEVKAKYLRRIERFKETLRTTKRVLLVYWTRTERLEEALLKSAVKRLREHFHSRGIDLLVLQTDTASRRVVWRTVSRGIIVVTGPLYDAKLNVVMGNVALCNGIYARIRRKEDVIRRIRERLQLTVMRMCTAFHLSSAARRRARERWRERQTGDR